MKLLTKIGLFSLVLTLFMACDSVELDLQDNPNSVSPEQADINDLYNNAQLALNGVFGGAQGQPGSMVRMYNMGSFNYESATAPGSYNGLWSTVYSNLLPDLNQLIKLGGEKNLHMHVGTAKIMKAYAMMALVDLLGDVPYADAGQGTDVISPTAESGKGIYDISLGLLDEAIADLGKDAASPRTDLYYGGSAAKWITLANTLKLRAAVTTRLVNGSAKGIIDGLVAGGDLIDEAGEDFQFQYGKNRTNPDARHWMYRGHYEQGDGAYLSNFYMWMLRGEKLDAEGNEVKDPRLRYYFYRKSKSSVNLDPTTYSCHFSAVPDPAATPAHWKDVDERIPYCVASADGYYGRDHGNGEGTPPDGPIKTSYGLYPGGGAFDYNSFADTRKSGTTGSGGDGINPIVLSSFVDFWRAEAALTLGTVDDAREMLKKGMESSIAKVMSFGSKVSGTMNIDIEVKGGGTKKVSELYVPTADEVKAYVDLVLANYDAADDKGKLNIIMKEAYIAMWGNGYDAYNAYRRTGMPLNMQPTLEPAGGEFPNSFYLPSNHVDRNANATQKSLADRVFWDDGSATTF